MIKKVLLHDNQTCEGIAREYVPVELVVNANGDTVKFIFGLTQNCGWHKARVVFSRATHCGSDQKDQSTDVDMRIGVKLVDTLEYQGWVRYFACPQCFLHVSGPKSLGASVHEEGLRQHFAEFNLVPRIAAGR